ncbi:MAG: 3-methyladenine DNA glycosylase AlkD [Bacteriovoracaceae bacterium]|jgi:3-methyladenine DNA glycosylase AlkD
MDYSFVSCLKEVEKKLKLYGRKPKKSAATAATPEIYNTELEVWFLSTPKQRELHKRGFSFSKEPHHIQKRIWKFIWNKSNVFEVKTQSLFYYQSRRSDVDFERYFIDLKAMVGGIENWAHSDVYSDCLSRILEANPKKVMPTLEKWNKSMNPWKRRQSLVSLFYYQSLRKTYPPKTKVFKFIKELLKDEMYYVQKGVGWTLRESIQAYPKETYAFVEKHLEDLSSIAFTTVMEKVPATKKEKYKVKRSRARAFARAGKTKTVKI